MICFYTKYYTTLIIPLLPLSSSHSQPPTRPPPFQAVTLPLPTMHHNLTSLHSRLPHAPQHNNVAYLNFSAPKLNRQCWNDMKLAAANNAPLHNKICKINLQIDIYTSILSLSKTKLELLTTNG